MAESYTEAVLPKCFQFPESLRLLWEGTWKALEEAGMDPQDVVSLCTIIVRLADDRLFMIERCGSPPGSESVADQVRHYRALASDLLRRASTPPPEPDWHEINKKLREAGAAPLDLTAPPKG